MDQLDEMLEQFKDFASLQKFAEAQQRAIQTLSKKIKALEDENAELKANPSSISERPETTFQLEDLGYGSDEEVISKIQLARLKEVSMERELTLEEAKRVEIFSKIIISKEKNKTFDFAAKKVDSTDLLKMIENESGSEH
jgi:cell division protein FtsB